MTRARPSVRQLTAALVAVLVCLLVWTQPTFQAHSVPGEPDKTFDGDGTATSDFGGLEAARSIALQEVEGEQRLLVAGTFERSLPDVGQSELGLNREANAIPTDFLLARYKSDGTLDSSFGVQGSITTDFEATDRAFELVVQEDGKILVGGQTCAGPDHPQQLGDCDFALARYTPNGLPDATFGLAGEVITDFAYQEQINGLALDEQGRILAVGRFGDLSRPGRIDRTGVTAIARYLTTGTPDHTFGTLGIVTTDQINLIARPGHELGLLLQSNGNILLGGATPYRSNCEPCYDFRLVRFNTEGTLDEEFGTNGIVTTDVTGRGDAIRRSDTITDLTMQPDGKIVATGYAQPQSNTGGDGVLTRYTSAGVLDPTFGPNGTGIALTDLGGDCGFFSGVAAQDDGKLVAGGAVGDAGPDGCGAFGRALSVARYSADGQLDPSFGEGDGIVEKSFGTEDSVLYDLAIQADGKIWGAGEADGNFGLVRLLGSTTDLSISNLASLPVVEVGKELTFTVTVTNNGPDDVGAVKLTNQLPAALSGRSLVASQGGCAGEGTVTCSVGPLAKGASATITVKGTAPASPMRLSSVAQIINGQYVDPVAANNVSTAIADVVPAGTTPQPPGPGVPDPIIPGQVTPGPPPGTKSLPPVPPSGPVSASVSSGSGSAATTAQGAPPPAPPSGISTVPAPVQVSAGAEAFVSEPVPFGLEPGSQLAAPGVGLAQANEAAPRYVMSRYRAPQSLPAIAIGAFGLVGFLVCMLRLPYRSASRPSPAYALARR